MSYQVLQDNPERTRKAQRKYRDTKNGKQKSKEYYENNKEKIFKQSRERMRNLPDNVKEAYKAVQEARRKGDLVKEPCVVCGLKRSQAHHEDYDKPLEVIWLCRRHHAERHHK